AVVVEGDVVRQGDVEQGARLAVVGQRILLVIDLDGLVERQERHLVRRHYDFSGEGGYSPLDPRSMISSARFVPSAPLSAASIITSARCSVAWFRSLVRSRMASRSSPSRAARSAATAASIVRRSSAPSSGPARRRARAH